VLPKDTVHSQNSIALPHLHLQIREPSLDLMLNLFFNTIFSSLRSRQSLVLENIALRHQLVVLRRNNKTPHLKSRDRLLWVILSQIHTRWRSNLVIVQPKTVVGWHRKGRRMYWRWKCRSKRQGRPTISIETRDLIRKISRENPLWGAPRIHGELGKLGIEVGETTVARYMIQYPKPPSQTWRIFIKNHMTEIVAIDSFTVPTVTFRVLYVFVILSLDRRRIVHFNVTDSPTAEWTSLQLTQAFPFDTAPRF
jgi:putative transposase